MNRLQRPLSASVVAALALLSACSSTPKDEYVERPVEELYNKAVTSLEKGEWRTAAKDFDEVERQHPYSVWATKAQLMAAFAHYQADKYDEAIAALDRFIQLHPGNKDTAYAYYMKALCYYEQISDVGRDQKFTEEALKALKEVVARFPDSPYARDAKLKIDLAHDHLAGKEMEIGRWYQRQEHHLAAINRFRVVVDQYQTTTHVAEALHRLVESYTVLGLADEAQKVAAVLGHNYPGADWYADSYSLVKTGQTVEAAEKKNRKTTWLTWPWNWLR